MTLISRSLACSLSTFTRDYGNWSLNFEDADILSMDLVIKCGAGIVGPKASDRTGLDFYTNCAPYRFEEDADLLEWAIPQDLREKFDLANAAQTVGQIISTYEAEPNKYNKRVPLFLKIGGMCTGLLEKNGPLKTRFVDKLAFVALNLRIEVQISPT